MKRYFWLKFKTDFFSTPQIKKIRKISGGDTFVIIYLKLQLLSVPKGGIINLTGIEENYWDELALMIDEDSENIQITCIYLMQYGLMQMLDDYTIYLPDASDNIGSEGDSAQRMRRARERKKQQDRLPASQSDIPRLSQSDTIISSQSDVFASQSDATMPSQCDTIISSQSDVNGLSQSDATMPSQCDSVTSQSDETPQTHCNKTATLPKETTIYSKASLCDDRERKRERDIYRSISQNQKQKIQNNTNPDSCQDKEKDFFIFCCTTAFHKLFGRDPNKSFITSVCNLAQDGLQISDIQEAILTASKNEPRKPEPYILTICKHLLQRRQAEQSSPNDTPLADWEVEWLEEVQFRKSLMTDNV